MAANDPTTGPEAPPSPPRGGGMGWWGAEPGTGFPGGGPPPPSPPHQGEGSRTPASGAPAWDAEEARRARAKRIERVARWLLPLIVVILTVIAWDLFSSSSAVRERIFPRPGTVWEQFLEDRALLFGSLLVTLKITVVALAISIIGSVALAILFTQSRFAELVFLPYAVVLQVTPIVAVAPLIFIYVTDPFARVLVCAWIVAFFPLLANTTTGLKSTDHNLSDLFRIYGATWWQRLVFLKLPFALPFFLAGLRIAGGLALIGAIVAEYVAGISGSASGLAFRILEASYRYNYPRMFAALILIALVGVIIFALTSFLSWVLLRRWHESAVERDG